MPNGRRKLIGAQAITKNLKIAKRDENRKNSDSPAPGNDGRWSPEIMAEEKNLCVRPCAVEPAEADEFASAPRLVLTDAG